MVRGNEGLDVIIREGRDRGAANDLFAFDPDGGGRRNLTADWDLIPGGPVTSPDGHVYFSAGVSGNTHLFRVAVNGGAVEQVTGGGRRLAGFSFSADFSRMAYRVTTPTEPGDIHVAPVSGAAETRLSEVNAALLAELDLSEPENLIFHSPDGTEVRAGCCRRAATRLGAATSPWSW